MASPDPVAVLSLPAVRPLAAPVASIPAPQLLLFLLQAGLLLAMALVLGRLARRFGLPMVVGELLVGVLLGPSLLDHLAPGVSHWLLPKQAGQFHLLDAVGQVGLVLLVGVTGIEVDLRLARRRGATALRVSSAGLLLPLALGIAAGFVLPALLVPPGVDRATFALFLGVAMCVSAIPVIAKILTDMKLLDRDIGQLTLAAGMVDDVVGWLLLSVVSAMATTGVRAGSVALAVLYLVLIVGLAATVGRWLVALALRWANRYDDGVPTVAVAVILIVLCAAATAAAGMEPAFGAFIGGILIGSSPELRLARLAPLRTVTLAVFAPLFFATAGLRMDLTALGRPVVLLAGLAILVIAVVGKFAGAFIGAVTSRLTRWEGLALGAGMNARGVIQVVVATVGLRLGVLDTATYTIVILVAIATSVMAPPILRTAMRRVERTAEEDLRERALADFRQTSSA
jgi:Kef-type K+ transport system membrane component KefB